MSITFFFEGIPVKEYYQIIQRIDAIRGNVFNEFSQATHDLLEVYVEMSDLRRKYSTRLGMLDIDGKFEWDALVARFDSFPPHGIIRDQNGKRYSYNEFKQVAAI